MRRGRMLLVLLFVVLLAVPAGAVAYWKLAPSHDAHLHCKCPQAQRILHEHAGGKGNAHVSFHVPPGAAQLRVSAHYHLDGQATFTLWSEDYRRVESARGDNALHNDHWMIVARPAPGEWGLSSRYEADGAMTFAVYW